MFPVTCAPAQVGVLYDVIGVDVREVWPGGGDFKIAGAELLAATGAFNEHDNGNKYNHTHQFSPE